MNESHKTLREVQEAAAWSNTNKLPAFLVLRDRRDRERVFHLVSNHMPGWGFSRLRGEIMLGDIMVRLLSAQENPQEILRGLRGRLFFAHDAFPIGADLIRDHWRKTAMATQLVEK